MIALMLLACALLALLTVASLGTRSPVVLTTALVAGLIWNLCLPSFSMAARWSVPHPVWVLLCTPLALAAARRLFKPGEHRWPTLVTLWLTLLFLASFLVPYQMQCPWEEGCDQADTMTLRALLGMAYHWSALGLVLAVLSAWVAWLLEPDRPGSLLALTQVVGIPALSFGTLFSFALAPMDSLLLSPLIGLLCAMPVHALWRFELSRQDLVVRALLTDLMLLVPVAGAAWYLYPWVMLAQPLPLVQGLFVLQTLIALLLGIHLIRKLAVVIGALLLDRMLRQAARGVTRDGLVQGLDQVQGLPLTTNQHWRLSELLTPAYDDNLRRTVAAAVSALKRQEK
jgi:hypothetical protein